jgi:hypothetical protein
MGRTQSTSIKVLNKISYADLEKDFPDVASLHGRPRVQGNEVGPEDGSDPAEKGLSLLHLLESRHV